VVLTNSNTVLTERILLKTTGKQRRQGLYQHLQKKKEYGKRSATRRVKSRGEGGNRRQKSGGKKQETGTMGRKAGNGS
jgi:hypothetical protein